jgi:hypothetical protein
MGPFDLGLENCPHLVPMNLDFLHRQFLLGVPTARSRNRSLIFHPNASSTSKQPLRSESQQPGFELVTTIELKFMFSDQTIQIRTPGRVRIFSSR